MAPFELFARPWWVNILIIVSFAAYAVWWKRGLRIEPATLVLTALYAVAMGYLEAATVVYLRISGALLGTDGKLIGMLQGAVDLSTHSMNPSLTLATLPAVLGRIETFREAATILMLVMVACLAIKSSRERWAIFLWIFAFWDLSYYAGLWFSSGWPNALTTADVLFLIPVPWYAQVWFPYLVSGLTVAAVILGRKES